jgi:hypothetical protein
MTLEEIENSLPNGLHDAEMHQLVVDYAKRTLTAELAVWVGDMDDPPDRRETYRVARIDVEGLLFLIMEPPDPKYPFDKSIKLTIDGCDMRESLNASLLSSMPSKSFFRSFWVGEWNAFIHLAGADARFSWVDDARVRIS